MEIVRLQFELIRILDIHACSHLQDEAGHRVRRYLLPLQRTQLDRNRVAAPLDISN